MILRSSLAIISDKYENLEDIDSMLMDDSILDDMVKSTYILQKQNIYRR